MCIVCSNGIENASSVKSVLILSMVVCIPFHLRFLLLYQIRSINLNLLSNLVLGMEMEFYQITFQGLLTWHIVLQPVNTVYYTNRLPHWATFDLSMVLMCLRINVNELLSSVMDNLL